MEADFFHLAWSCTLINRFWVQVTQIASEMVAEQIDCTPQLCLLGIANTIKPGNRKLVNIITLLAKRQVAMHWGKKAAPKVEQWLNDSVHCRDQLNIYAEELPTTSRPKDVWGPATTYLLTLQAESVSPQRVIKTLNYECDDTVEDKGGAGQREGGGHTLLM